MFHQPENISLLTPIESAVCFNGLTVMLNFCNIINCNSIREQVTTK
jgi:hypothetical protein